MASDTPQRIQDLIKGDHTANIGLEDIQYLLYLETVRRAREEEQYVRQRVEEKARELQEVTVEYRQLYAKYVKLIQLAATHAVLNEADSFNDSAVQAAKDKVDAMKCKLNKNSMLGQLDQESLAQCKQLLSSCKARTGLAEMQSNLATATTLIKTIQAATETVEVALEMATVQGLDRFVTDLQP